jgi:hypothetical protein
MLLASISPFTVIAFFFSSKDFNIANIFLPSYFLLPALLVCILFVLASYFIKQDIKLLQRSDRLWS